MTPDRWRKVEDVFRAALDRDAGERGRFIDDACRHDVALRKEVVSLLAAHEQAGSFLEQPAIPARIVGQVATQETPRGATHTFSVDEIVGRRFKIVRFIAEGGMGEVYQAWDTELHEAVALKTVRLAFAGDKEAELRFKREIQLARKVTHPNVCRIFDMFHHEFPADPDNGRLEEQVSFLTMELLAGETLAERLRRSGPINPRNAMQITRQIGAALGAAHDVGIVHRDLKPANVMLVKSSSGTRVVVTDFGLARGRRPRPTVGATGTTNLLWMLHSIQAHGSENSGARSRNRLISTIRAMSGDTSTGLGAVMGTPGYMAPEQLLGAKVDRRADIFALGVIMYQMLTGEIPYRTKGMINKFVVRVTQRPPAPRKLNPEVPKYLDEVILKCLETDREARYLRVVDVLRDLDRKKVGSVGGGIPSKLLLALGGAAVTTVAILLYFVFRS